MIAAAASTMRIRSLERSFLYIISLHNPMGDLGLVIVPLCRSDDAQSSDFYTVAQFQRLKIAATANTV